MHERKVGVRSVLRICAFMLLFAFHHILPVYFAMVHMCGCAVRALLSAFERIYRVGSFSFPFFSLSRSLAPSSSAEYFSHRILAFACLLFNICVCVWAVLTYLFYLRHMMRLWGALTYTRFAWIFWLNFALCALFRNSAEESSLSLLTKSTSFHIYYFLPFLCEMNISIYSTFRRIRT